MHALHQSLALDLLFDARSHSNDWDLSCGRDAVCRGLLYAKSSDGFSTFLRTDMVWPLCWSTIGFQLNHDTFFGWTVNKQSSQYYLDPCLSLKKKEHQIHDYKKGWVLPEKMPTYDASKNPKKQQVNRYATGESHHSISIRGWKTLPLPRHPVLIDLAASSLQLSLEAWWVQPIEKVYLLCQYMHFYVFLLSDIWSSLSMDHVIVRGREWGRERMRCVVTCACVCVFVFESIYYTC